MRNTTLRKSFFIAASLIVALAFHRTALADQRDGIRHWWKVKTLSDGTALQPSDIYDVMTVGATTPLTASAIVQNTDSPDAVPVCASNGVKHLVMRYTAANETAISINNPKSSDGTKINNQSINLPNAASVGGEEATVVVRFKWNGIKKRAGTDWYYPNLYCNGWSWGTSSTTATGWCVGLGVYDSSTGTSMYPTLTIGQNRQRMMGSSHDSRLHVEAGKWHEMAIAWRRGAENKVTATFYFRIDGKWTYPDLVTATRTFISPAKLPTEAGRVTAKIGSGGSSTFSSDAETAFSGMISDIRVYDKMLSANEVYGAFADEDRLSAFTIGSVNASANEFSDVDPAAVFEPATMPWSKFRKTLSASQPAVTIKAEILPGDVKRGRVMTVAAVPSVARQAVRVAYNGTTFGEKRFPQDGTPLHFWISPDQMKTLVRDESTGRYPLTLTVTRTDESVGDIALDAVYMGGAWQIGAADDKKTDFGGTDYFNYQYFVAQQDWKQLSGALSTSMSYYAQHVYFSLTDWEAQKLTHVLQVKAALTQSSPVDLLINGTVFKSFKVGDFRESYWLEIPPNTFQGGNNDILLRNTTTTWVSMDCLGLVSKWDQGKNYDPRGMAVIVR